MSDFKLLPTNLNIQYVQAWAITFFLTGILIVLFFAIQPALIGLSNSVESTLQAQGMDSAQTTSTISFIRLAVNVAIPIVIAGLWIWAWAKSQPEETRGYYVE